MFYFSVSVIVLAVLLFFPVSKLIWVWSVRRLKRKLGHELSQDELSGQLTRARFIAMIVCLIFSLLFNINIVGIPSNG